MKMKKVKLKRFLKVVNRRINYLLIYLIISLASYGQKSLHKSNSGNFKNTYCYKIKEYTGCAILGILSDSILLKTKVRNEECFRVLINELANKSKIEPSWNCDLGGCNYFSYSLDRSIYKLDIVKWMKFFNCSDTIRMFSSSKNSFPLNEVKYLITINKFNPGRIDTMILYPKY